MQDQIAARRAQVPAGVTVYDAFPGLAQLHNVDRRHYPDLREPVFWDVFDRWKAFTCLTVERFYNIFKSVEYIARSGIPGDFAACGVFLGGSIFGAALFARHFSISDRRYYLFDTFEGFPTRTIETDLGGTTQDLSTIKVVNGSFRHIVERNLAATGLDPDRFVLVPGKVEETLKNGPQLGPLAYLRLDTDYFESTLVELQALYPKLSRGGVLIIDDYGHFEGCRRAVDLYFERSAQAPLLHRVDYTGRCAIKG
jgi:O-methyltransferase